MIIKMNSKIWEKRNNNYPWTMGAVNGVLISKA